jgi:hypothetical protein
LNAHITILKNKLELEQWTTGGSTNRIGSLSSAFEKAGMHQLEQIFKFRQESCQRTPKNIFSISLFHLNRMEK